MCFIRLGDPARNQRDWETRPEISASVHHVCARAAAAAGPAAASCLCASRELPCADVPTASGLEVDPWATRPLLQSGSSLLPSRQKQGRGSRPNALGVRDQGWRRGGLPSCEPRGPQGSFMREPPDVPSSGRARGRRAPSALHRLYANVPSSLSARISTRCALQLRLTNGSKLHSHLSGRRLSDRMHCLDSAYVRSK